MDLLSMARKIWHYKLATLPIALLTVLGAAYVVAVKKPVYEASSTYVLINPPSPPTPEEVARQPSLGRAHTDNPYTRFSDQSVVVELLASTVSSESARSALARQGADRRYRVERTAEFGSTSPMVEITGVGWSPRAAIRTAEIVGSGIIRQLNKMQHAQGVDPRYRIKTSQVNAPDSAQLRASAQVRPLVAVLALGAVLMFIAVSVAEAVRSLRMEHRAGLQLEPLQDPSGQANAVSGVDTRDSSQSKRDSLDDEQVKLLPEPNQDPTAKANGAPAGRGLTW